MNSQSINQAANLAFAPWEQMLEMEKSASIDVYTLAASLFFLVTGHTPTPCLKRKMLNNDLIEPKRINSRIIDRLNKAIIKGLELEHRNRPQSMKEWVALFPDVNNVETFHVKSLQAPLNNQELQLKSAVGMDYTKLQNYLKTGNWKQADEETRRVMIAVVKREKEGWLDVESIDNFCCEDLRTIDHLWVKYSNGKFGLSVQKRVYQGLGGTKSYDENKWNNFGDKVGWRKWGSWLYYQDITFDIKAPEGHLPSNGVGLFSGAFGRFCLVEGVVLLSIASRLVNCNI